MQIFPCWQYSWGEILDMVSNTGAVAKAVLLILLAFSLISWAIILTKWSLLRRARVQSGHLSGHFAKLSGCRICCRRGSVSSQPASRSFEASREYKRQIANNSGLLRVDGIRRACRLAHRKRSRVWNATCLARDHCGRNSVHWSVWYSLGHY